jgi:hypothetical protein
VFPKPGSENGDADGLSRFQLFSTCSIYEQGNFIQTAQIPEDMSKAEETKKPRTTDLLAMLC